jgi:hypothetical protein
MRISFLSLSLVCLAGSPIAARATDLAKIDRTLAREPVYEHKPKYCLLVCGPEAKTRVWLVVDGDVLYVDRNGNGDVTERDERVSWTGRACVAGDLTCVPGKDGHTTLRLRRYGSAIELTLWHEGKLYSIGHQELDPLVFADRASDAPVAHIGGPQSLALSYYWPGAEQPLKLFVRVGTPGLGKGVFAARHLATVEPRVVAATAIEFPAEGGGNPPTATKATLDECCCCFAEGFVRVPDRAGKGVARVTVRIPDWKESVLAPASFAVPLDPHRLGNPPPKIQTAKPWKEKQP